MCNFALGHSLRQVLALTFIILIATVPFLGKAFHIDDALYLYVARQILEKPWDPFSAEVLWEKVPESLFDANFNPPLWNYLMAGVLALTGEPTVKIKQGITPSAARTPEIALHLLESCFVAAAILATFLIARRFVRWPLTATMLVVLSPAMLPGQNVMLEGPLLAFWLWGLWSHLRAIETNDVRWVWISGMFSALGVLTKYTSALLLIIVLVHTVRRRYWQGLWCLIPPVAALGLWSLHNLVLYDRAHLLVIFNRIQTGERQGQGVDLVEAWGRVFALFRCVGAVTALAIPIIYVMARRFGIWAAISLLVLATGLSWTGMWDMSNRLFLLGLQLEDATTDNLVTKYSGTIHALIFGASGAFALVGLMIVSCRQVKRCLSSGDEFVLWTWLGCVVSFCVLAVPFLAVRHVLAGILPLVCLVLRRLEEVLDAHRSNGRWVLGWTAIPTVLCGFLVAKGDYDFAEWYRHIALDVSSEVVQRGRKHGVDVWFTGNWGWAYYAQRVGMKPFVEGTSDMKPGDFLLLPLIQTWKLPSAEMGVHLHNLWNLRPDLETADRSNSIWQVVPRWCLNSFRTISVETQYYSGGTVNLPWRVSRKPLDDFAVTEYRQ